MDTQFAAYLPISPDSNLPGDISPLGESLIARLVNGTNNAFISGTNGDDTLLGGRGNDFIAGQLGNDTIRGGAGNDFILPMDNDGDDRAFGGRGNDLFDGGGGNDALVGGKGNDALLGAAGDDVIEGSTGNDLIFGGEGKDTIIIAVGAGVDFIAGFNPAEDVVGLSGGLTFEQLSIEAIGPSSLIKVAETGELLAQLGGVPADQISPASFKQVESIDSAPRGGFDVVANALSAAPFLSSAQGQTQGTDNADFLNGSRKRDEIRGGLGEDTISGGGGRDRLFGDEGDDLINGDAGNDLIEGGSGNDFMNGGRGKDQLVGGAGDDFMNGGRGKDTLIAEDGNDILNGGLGSDLLDGGAGFNILSGGGGRDRFVLSADGRFDQIFDFEDGVDKLVLENLSLGQLSFVQTGASTLVSLTESSAPLAVINNIEASQITAADLA